MPRRTKEDAACTRRQIIEAARQIFAQRGVSRTTLEQIAQAAGVTRGAIYWHFKDKTELFFAMRDQVKLPLLDGTQDSLLGVTSDPLSDIEQFLLAWLETLGEDTAARQTFEIINFKCEYVDEFGQVGRQTLSRCQELVDNLTRTYQLAQDKGLLRADLNPRLAGLQTYLFMTGLVRLWLADCEGAIVRPYLHALINSHLGACRQPAAAGAAGPVPVEGQAAIPGQGQ